jgi:hypothetical protein
VGAFLAFTLSQWGMVYHWKRFKVPGALRYQFVNAAGAIVTGITVVVVLVAKFTQGAWVMLLLVPGMVMIMIAVRRQYHRMGSQIASQSPLVLTKFQPPLVVVPVDRWSKIAQRALTFSLNISTDVIALHVVSGERAGFLEKQWYEYVEAPVTELGMIPPKLVVVHSPYRFIINPIVDYVLELSRKNPGRQIAVLIPEVIEAKWYYHVLHNQRAAALKTLLYFKGNPAILVINMPWYVSD